MTLKLLFIKSKILKAIKKIRMMDDEIYINQMKNIIFINFYILTKKKTNNY